MLCSLLSFMLLLKVLLVLEKTEWRVKLAEVQPATEREKGQQHCVFVVSSPFLFFFIFSFARVIIICVYILNLRFVFCTRRK